jgi:hypothetical protein
MIREKLIEKDIGRGEFRWRGHEVSRIEGLSDAVFAFAITLLLIVFIGGAKRAGLAGMIYMFSAVVLTVSGMVMGKRRSKLEQQQG